MVKYSKARVQWAIDGSVQKWLDIATGHAADQGSANCPLCQLFFWRDDTEDCCWGCPVSKKTGQTGCRGTPYYQFAGAFYEDLMELAGLSHHPLAPMTAIGPKSQQAALEEAEFLSKLKP